MHLTTGGIDPLPDEHGVTTGEIRPPAPISLRTASSVIVASIPGPCCIWM